MLKQLRHGNIVQYIDCVLYEDKSMYIVLELVENGSLKDIIEKFGAFPESLSARYCFQVLQGLKYLHSKNIVHHDIKCANILITRDGICKLADFGVTTKIRSNAFISSLENTYWSMILEFVCF